MGSPRASACDVHLARYRALLPAAVVLLALLSSLIAPASSRAAFPGANGRIAFAANPPPPAPQGDFEIFTVKADGTDVLGPLTSNEVTEQSSQVRYPA